MKSGTGHKISDVSEKSGGGTSDGN